MENKSRPQKEDFKIVSRPSNEEIEDDETGSYHSKSEKRADTDEPTVKKVKKAQQRLNDQNQGIEDG